MVSRTYLSGHAAREYSDGTRTISGFSMLENLKEKDKFETHIITPTTKADNINHDEDI
jgi:phosphoribosylaminoimidazole-succinocarboxamide synthase